MYRIGQFSQITKVTVKALRFYEEEGLIEPRFVDPVNGYRYYGSDQLPRMYRIVSLRQCGFSIPEIRSIIGGRNLPAIFAERKRQLEERAVETAAQLASINHYIESMKEEGLMKYNIVVKELPRVIVYSRRMIMESYDSYFSVIPRIGEEVIAANPGLRCLDNPPYCFIMYHDGEYKDHDIDVEYCEAVTDWGVDTDTIKFKIMERVPQAACALHKGPYSELSHWYGAVFKWIEDNNLIAAGCPRESYIDGIWNTAGPAEWLTEVQVPISGEKNPGLV